MSQIQIHQGGIKQQAVEQVEDAADAGKEISGILYARFAFEQGLDKVADDRGYAENYAKDNRVFPIHATHLVTQEVVEDEAGECGHDNCADKAFPGFARTDARNHFVLTDQRADCISAGIAEFRDEHKVKQVVMTFHVREEVDFLNEVQEPGNIHEAEQCSGDGKDAGSVAL